MEGGGASHWLVSETLFKVTEFLCSLQIANDQCCIIKIRKACYNATADMQLFGY